MTRARARRMTIAGLVLVLLQGLLFGNQVVHDWAWRRGPYEATSVIGWLLRVLAFPEWRVTPGDLGVPHLLVTDLSFLLLLVTALLLMRRGVRTLTERGGGFGALVVGWWATFVAGAVMGLVQGLLWQLVGDPVPGAVLMGLNFGATYGLVVGWLPGLAMASVYTGGQPEGSTDDLDR